MYLSLKYYPQLNLFLYHFQSLHRQHFGDILVWKNRSKPMHLYIGCIDANCQENGPSVKICCPSLLRNRFHHRGFNVNMFAVQLDITVIKLFQNE